MNRLVALAFFAVGAALIGHDLLEYYQVQRGFHHEMLIPILLLGILGYFAFPAKLTLGEG